MFKIAFPWAKTDEEKNEREYLKSREYTSQEEVAGNVWISPLFGRSINLTGLCTPLVYPNRLLSS